jgi:hypothetical protein
MVREVSDRSARFAWQEARSPWLQNRYLLSNQWRFTSARVERVVHVAPPLQLLARNGVRPRVDGTHWRRKNKKLPRPTSVCLGIFDRQCMWQMHATESCRQIFFVQRLRLLQLTLQWRYQNLGQYSDAIFIAFALAN